jgi:hypothetical protein
LFTVRIWSDADGDRLERGSVHDVATGAFRNFRDWSDLTSFLTDRIEEGKPMKGNAMITDRSGTTGDAGERR